MERKNTNWETLNIDFEQEKGNIENVEVKEMGNRGRGIVARKDFKKGEVVFEVFGSTISYATDYTIPINETEKVEPRINKSVAQYMNHNCNPNIAPDKNGRKYIAMRDIKKGEEVATFYGFLGYEFGNEKSIDGKEDKTFDLTCNCGAENCTGKLRAYKDLTEEERLKWKDFILPFLLDKSKYK